LDGYMSSTRSSSPRNQLNRARALTVIKTLVPRISLVLGFTRLR
jgi:hypothetical protein